jgi:pimeloyl-ACP methyl ester carboxylesterase
MMKLNKHLTCLLALLLITATTFGQQSSSLHVTVTGHGQRSAILIPGFTCSGKVWDATVQKLSASYTCHVITFAGFAGTPAEADPHLENWVADIASYITIHHLNKPIVIGHSIGGGMAMMLAAARPELVSKIVVVDALPCLSALQNPSFKANPNADCSPFIGRYVAMSDSLLLTTQKQITPTLCADTEMQPQIVHWSMQSDRKTMGQIYCEFINTDLRDTIAGIHCPALILLEAPFRMYDAAMQQQFAKLPNKQIAYAEKGLHFIMYDDKNWYFKQLNAFLQ